MNTNYQKPDLSRRSFASTNLQTIAQRVAILRERLPGVQSIAELCCGDCYRQWTTYKQQLNIQIFGGLDIEAAVVARNRQLGIDCICGDVLNTHVLGLFLAFDVLFFGPPLSVDCDGHHALAFHEITPSYAEVAKLLLAELRYDGTFVCICPKTTTMGEISWLWHQIQHDRPDVGLSLIHYSHSTETGNGEDTELRLKYIELWFSNRLGNTWEIHNSRS